MATSTITAPGFIVFTMSRDTSFGAVARTSTFALNNVTLPFTLALAGKGWREALAQDPHLRNGLNVCEGKLTCAPVAQAHGLPYVSAESVLGL